MGDALSEKVQTRKQEEDMHDQSLESVDGGDKVMNKWMSCIIVLAVLSGFLLGCAANLKDNKVRCPKCGAFFSTREGEKAFERMGADPYR